MNRQWLVVGVAVSIVAEWAQRGAAQVRGTIFGPGTRSYPVAISPLKDLSNGAAATDAGTHFADIVARDLTVAGYFKILDRAAYIEKPETSGYTADAINFDNWSVIGALALVKGAYTMEGDNLTVEVRLFDVYQRKQLAGRRYHGSAGELLVLASRAHFLVWNPDIDAHKVWTAAGGNWDDELGWPSPHDAVAPPRDRTGAKYNPDFSQSEYPCASAYGDSYVWGEEIPLTDGWIEQLSRKLGCRVANYGVGMYGTDQSYVRFLHNRQDESPVALLGIFPENIVLNVNQYRGFLGYSPSPTGLKGRFVLDRAGRLEWVHRPRIDETGFQDFLRDPANLLPDE
jgi:hypothetical protein